MWSRDVAQLGGEAHGRSVSGVWGDGLASLLGGRNDGAATDVVHAGLAAGIFGVAAGKIPLRAIFSTAAALWTAGQSRAATSRYRDYP